MLFKMNLCRPDGKNSCASCCNIFHLKNPLRNSVKQFLARRTNIWKTARNISEYIKKLERVEEKDVLGLRRPCYFLGFVEGEETVGCLIHPDRIGREIRGNFCAEQKCIDLNEFPEVRTLINLARNWEDWYIYSAFMEFCVRHGQPFLKSKFLEYLVKHKIPASKSKKIVLAFCEEAVKHIRNCTSLACPGFDICGLDKKFLPKLKNLNKD